MNKTNFNNEDLARWYYIPGFFAFWVVNIFWVLAIAVITEELLTTAFMLVVLAANIVYILIYAILNWKEK